MSAADQIPSQPLAELSSNLAAVTLHFNGQRQHSSTKKSRQYAVYVQLRLCADIDPAVYDSGNGKLHTRTSRVAGHLATIVKFSQVSGPKGIQHGRRAATELLLRSIQTIPFFGPFDETTGVDPDS